MSTIHYYAFAQPAANALESSLMTAVNNSRFQGIAHDISKAKTDNSFERTKDLIKGFECGTIKFDK
jgi:hypothetical protein